VDGGGETEIGGGGGMWLWLEHEAPLPGHEVKPVKVSTTVPYWPGLIQANWPPPQELEAIDRVHPPREQSNHR